MAAFLNADGVANGSCVGRNALDKPPARRVPGVDKGPRTIDIDILLAGETVLETPELIIPHPGLAGRNFVLIPLCEIAPRAVHPVLRKSVRELLRACPDRSSVLKAGRQD